MIKESIMENTNLPAGWEIFKFGEICKFVRGPFGGSLKKSIFKESGFAVYEQKHAIYDRFDNVRYFVDEEKFNEMKRFELNSGDLIMSCSGTIGKIAIVPNNIQRGIINQALLILSPNKKVSNIYLKLWLQSENFQDSLKKYTKGAAIKNVASVKILKNIEFPLPPLPQQKQIVAILDKAFAAIDTAKANAKLNLQNAKELFESYLQNVFENKGDDWEEKTLGDENLLKIIDGDRGNNYPRKADFLDEGYCLFMNTKNVRVDGFLFNTKMFITREKDGAMGKGKLSRNDVVMTTRGTIGNLGVYDKNVPFENIRINSGMLIFRPNREVVTPQYLFELFRSGIMKNLIKKHVSGAAQPQLPIKTLVNFSLPIPKSIKEQEKIVQKLDTLSKQIKKLEAIYTQKIADLKEMKKSVLQKAFSGQLSEL
jgi:type I restriction enzyme S subunit